MGDGSVDEWPRYAQTDLADAEQEVNSFNNRCVLSQQAAEKALKAALQQEFGDVERTHNLNVLRNALPDGWRVKAVYPDLSELTEWYLDGRYLGGNTATAGDARRMLSTARGIYDSIVADIGERGG